MKYMMLIYGAENRWTPDDRTACMVESLAICDELRGQGKFIDAAPLQSVKTAATVRVRNGHPLVTDGPFAETTEHLGGYYVLDLADLDEAIAVASRLPPVSKGTVEIRPLFPLDGVPPARPLPADAKETPYLLLCYHSEDVFEATGPNSKEAAMAESVERVRELADTGRFLSAAPLRPAETATCVRVRDGKRFITDGPYAETHEVVGGYYLILANSRDEALAAAARQPGARFGGIEVRPLHDMSGLRNQKNS
jgi:hypothetical protein